MSRDDTDKITIKLTTEKLPPKDEDSPDDEDSAEEEEEEEVSTVEVESLIKKKHSPDPPLKPTTPEVCEMFNFCPEIFFFLFFCHSYRKSNNGKAKSKTTLPTYQDPQLMVLSLQLVEQTLFFFFSS